MGNSLGVSQIQGTVIDRFKSVCLTTDENGGVRIRSFSDGGQLTSRVAAEVIRDEHRLSLDVIHRVRHVRTSCTTIPEEDIVSAREIDKLCKTSAPTTQVCIHVCIFKNVLQYTCVCTLQYLLEYMYSFTWF
ncbi:unnamed protein product [Ceratitis capitata]|uniref:(Mediterranean fruit fly) hypothetical protein n=1 Tax=Ceratitis capitata TaxID=7213 RepID=A0A811UY78_CERCA|nr:unnamed protein product [Ceratitis capitata]